LQEKNRELIKRIDFKYFAQVLTVAEKNLCKQIPPKTYCLCKRGFQDLKIAAETMPDK